MTLTSTLEIARKYSAAGINLLPVRRDGSKAPAILTWTYLEKEPNTDEELIEFFDSGNGIAAIGGAISGNLEDFDFDDVATFNEWKELVIEHLGKEFWDRLLIVRTPRPGFAVIVRCPSGIEKSQKLAWAPNPRFGEPAEPEYVCLVETKGEGGYFLLPGCPSACHKTGRTYEIEQGDFGHIPQISAVEREVFLSCARSFDRKPREEYKPRSSPRKRTDGELLPGDDYKERGPDWRAILEPHGYHFHSSRGEASHWTRPGKDHGISASTNYAGSGLFYPFSTNCYPFDGGRGYNKFAVYAFLNHQGDFKAAARVLYADGYGTRRAKKKDPKVNVNEHQPDDGSLAVRSRTPLGNLSNAVKVLETDSELKGIVWFDEFSRRFMTGNPASEWSDVDDLRLTLYMQRESGLSSISNDIVAKAVQTIAFRNKRNCVCDWLDSLKWDHEPRVDHFFEDHFGASGTGYTRAASRNFWLSMVARARRPGCQADNMVVLEGPQGIKKSSALRKIGGVWFAEQHEAVTNAKAFAENLQGKLLVEISEMDAFSRAEVTRVKQAITNTNDRFREPWGRRAMDHPRQCIFVGTTNRDDWNRDDTGARRFWPIACQGEIDLEAIAANRSQLFAEADSRFKAGESWWEMPPEQTRVEQSNRYTAPAWVEPIQHYLEYEKSPINPEQSTTRAVPLTDVSVAELMEHALEVPPSQWNRANEMRVAECLRYLGFTKKDVRHKGRTVKRWVLVATQGGNGD